jgi:hypothetical protein
MPLYLKTWDVVSSHQYDIALEVTMKYFPEQIMNFVGMLVEHTTVDSISADSRKGSIL